MTYYQGEGYFDGVLKEIRDNWAKLGQAPQTDGTGYQSFHYSKDSKIKRNNDRFFIK